MVVTLEQIREYYKEMGSEIAPGNIKLLYTDKGDRSGLTSITCKKCWRVVNCGTFNINGINKLVVMCPEHGPYLYE